MATYTANLNLYKENEPTTKFQEWRNKMNGPTDSNMDKIDAAVAAKQDKLTGEQGQVVGFDASGNAVAQAAPDTGVTSFKGRNGAVTPQIGDYTAAQVGAVPTGRKVNGKALSEDISLSASDVGAVPTTRKVNNKALSEDIFLLASDVGASASNHTHTASQVGAVPATRKVNNKALGEDISLTASDVGAAASSHTHNYAGSSSAGGAANAAVKLNTSRTIQTNLGSTSSASFDGTANVAPGVTGVLDVTHGGTGVNSLDGLKDLIGSVIKETNADMLGVSTVLNENSWADIRKVSDAGAGANIWSVGDCKQILVNGTVGTLSINQNLCVYILGFNHNADKEGNGIQFGTFKTALSGGTDVCLVDSNYNNNNEGGAKYFNMNHWGYANYGGWKACDLRYDILGSTRTAPQNYGKKRASGDVGYDAPTNTATSPVGNTLMAALPSDLRAVMKPITKYTDNIGGSTGSTARNATSSVDYLPLLSEYEIFGRITYTHSYERNSQAQYDYYKAGNSRVKYRHSSTGSTALWWGRSPIYYGSDAFCGVGVSGGASYTSAGASFGLAPAFMV